MRLERLGCVLVVILAFAGMSVLANTFPGLFDRVGTMIDTVYQQTPTATVPTATVPTAIAPTPTRAREVASVSEPAQQTPTATAPTPTPYAGIQLTYSPTPYSGFRLTHTPTIEADLYIVHGPTRITFRVPAHRYDFANKYVVGVRKPDTDNIAITFRESGDKYVIRVRSPDALSKSPDQADVFIANVTMEFCDGPQPVLTIKKPLDNGHWGPTKWTCIPFGGPRDDIHVFPTLEE